MFKYLNESLKSVDIAIKKLWHFIGFYNFLLLFYDLLMVMTFYDLVDTLDYYS